MNKKLIIFAIFLASIFVTTDFAAADIVAPNMINRGCRNFQMTNISHNQSFNPGDSIDFTFSVECPRAVVALSSVPDGPNHAYPTKCSAAFGLGNEVKAAFGYSFGSVGDHVTGVWALVDVGGGYVRCAGTATYQFPTLNTGYRFALVYPIFTDYTNRSPAYQGGMNLGALGEHITHTCAETDWAPDPNAQCVGSTFTQTRTKTDCSIESRTANNGTKVCCDCDEEYYKVGVGATSACVGAKGICNSNCRKITNGCTLPIFVPAKTTPEWISLPITANNFAGCIKSVPCN